MEIVVKNQNGTIVSKFGYYYILLSFHYIQIQILKFLVESIFLIILSYIKKDAMKTLFLHFLKVENQAYI